VRLEWLALARYSRAVTDPSGTSESQERLRRAIAERDLLLELIAVFTHDLSNPLQSITVLSELRVDAVDDDERTARQCLAAARRMGELVHGLMGLTRSQGHRTTIGRVVEPIRSLIAGRIERHRLRVVIDVAEVANEAAAEPFALTCLCLVLGIVTSTPGRAAGGLLEIDGKRIGDRIRIRIHAIDALGAPMRPSLLHLERARALSAPSIELHGGSDEVLLWLERAAPTG
jgi:signal transduction histidine kinase